MKQEPSVISMNWSKMFKDFIQRINSRSVGLKMARRDVSRNKLQSFLVIAVISIPVALGSFAFTYQASRTPTPEERALYNLGQTQAKLVSTLEPSNKNYQTPLDERPFVFNKEDGGYISWEESGDPSKLVDPRTALKGYTWLSEAVTYQTTKTKTGQTKLPIYEVEAWDPNLQGRFVDFKGKAPSNENEVLVNAAGLKRLGVTIGEEVKLLDLGITFKIVGTIEDSLASKKSAEIFAQPGAITSKTFEDVETRYYAVGEKPVTWQEVIELNKLGIGALSRDVIFNPPAESEVPFYAVGGTSSNNSLANMLQVIFLLPLVLLPVVILTGSAFSFGARRQVRSIAVMSSLGAKKSTLRFITIANGLWLGFLGGVAGSVLGIIAAYFALPAIHDGSKTELPGFHIPWLLLTGVAISGAVIGAIVSIIPAFTASKVDVLSTLRGSRRDANVKKRSGIFGLILIAVGVATLLVSVPILIYLNAPETRTELGWQVVSNYQQTVVMFAVLASFVTIIGLMVASSWLLVFARFVFRRLGTAANFATNDLVFNRKRFTAVIASVIATSFVAAIVISTFYITTKPFTASYKPVGEPSQLQIVTEYSEDRLNSVDEVNSYINKRNQELNQMVKQASEIAPFSSAGTINFHRSFANLGYKYYDTGELMLGAEGQIPYVKLNFDYMCPYMESSPDYEKFNKAQMIGDWKLSNEIMNKENYLDCYRLLAREATDFVVGGPEDLRLLLGGRVDGAAETALSEGKAVVFSKGFLNDGKLQLDWHPSGLNSFAVGNKVYESELKYFPAQDVDGNLIDFTKPSRTEKLDAVLSASAIPTLNFIIPPKTAQSLGIDYYPMSAIVNYEGPLTVSDLDALEEAFPMDAVLERGLSFDLEGIAWLLAAIAGLFVFASTAIALGLSQIESRADHSTLWSIGASKSFRSRVVSFQALTLSLLGTLFGATVGMLLVYVLSSTLQADFVIPLPQTLFLVLGIPLLAALGFLVGTPKKYKFNPRLALD
jgi:putative ABC transport system permease protein